MKNKSPAIATTILQRKRYAKQLQFLMTTILLTGLASPLAFADDCHNDTIKKVAPRGGTLTMKSGQIYQVVTSYTYISIGWLSSDGVNICKSGSLYKITDTVGIGKTVLASLQK